MATNNFAVHPGETLKELLEDRKISSLDLAIKIRVPKEYIDKVVQGRMSISTEFAVKLEQVLGVDSDFWVNLQANYSKDMWKYRRAVVGQFYIVANISKKESLYFHCYNYDPRLMEHSFLGNSFMNMVEDLLSPGKAWHKSSIVWAGEHGEEGLFIPENDYTLYKKDCKYNLFQHVMDHYMEISPPCPDLNLDLRCLVNHDRKEYIDKKNLPPVSLYKKGRRTIHPLPILTSNSNGKGRRDYKPHKEEDKKYIGLWAGDSISMEYEIPNGYKDIDPGFCKNY